MLCSVNILFTIVQLKIIAIRNELEMCQYDKDAPAQGPSSPTRRYFAKNKVEKRAITFIIIGRLYPKLNLTYIL